MFLNLKNEGEMFQTKVVAVTSQSCNLKQNVKTQLRRICIQLLEHIAVEALSHPSICLLPDSELKSLNLWILQQAFAKSSLSSLEPIRDQGERKSSKPIDDWNENCKGAGSFHIHRKTLKELGAPAVLGIRERPNLAQNLVTHRHWWKNTSRAMTLPL